MAKKISRDNVSNMFNDIAPTYDRLNHILSLGTDRAWRRKAVRALRFDRNCTDITIADFATGTGDMAVLLAKKIHNSHIIGMDFSCGMLEVCSRKIQRKKLQDRITLKQENCQSTSLQDCGVDAVTCAFGIRNFENTNGGLQEMIRVLKPGGVAVILEFSTPRKGLIASLVKWYYMHIIPFMGRLIAGNRSAYTYLPATIYEFPCGQEFCSMMINAGFDKVQYKSLTFNIANLYIGYRAV